MCLCLVFMLLCQVGQLLLQRGHFFARASHVLYPNDRGGLVLRGLRIECAYVCVCVRMCAYVCVYLGMGICDARACVRTSACVHICLPSSPARARVHA